MKREVFIQFITDDKDFDTEKDLQNVVDTLFDGWGLDNISVKVEELTKFD